MKKRRRIWFALAAILVLAVFGLRWFRSTPQLSDRGKNIEEWIQQLERDETALEAKEVLLELGTNALPSIVRELNRTRPGSFSDHRLYRIAWEELSPVLRKNLPAPRSNQDMSVRRELCQIVGALGPDAAPALPGLRAATADTWGLLHHFAIQALGRIGPPAAEALPELSSCLESPDPVARRSAALALAHIGVTDPLTLRRLRRAAEETNEWVSAFAQLALWKVEPTPAHSLSVSNLLALGPPESRATLLSLLPRIAPPRFETETWLRHILEDPTQPGLVRSNALFTLDSLRQK